jgi:hypothetical protein
LNDVLYRYIDDKIDGSWPQDSKTHGAPFLIDLGLSFILFHNIDKLSSGDKLKKLTADVPFSTIM